MTKDAEQLVAEALKRVKLHDGFSPIELGAKIGLEKHQAEAAARALSNAGILVLGFDLAAHFSPDFRKSRKPPERKGTPKKARGTRPAAAAAS